MPPTFAGVPSSNAEIEFAARFTLPVIVNVPGLDPAESVPPFTVTLPTTAPDPPNVAPVETETVAFAPPNVVPAPTSIVPSATVIAPVNALDCAVSSKVPAPVFVKAFPPDRALANETVLPEATSRLPPLVPRVMAFVKLEIDSLASNVPLFSVRAPPPSALAAAIASFPPLTETLPSKLELLPDSVSVPVPCFVSPPVLPETMDEIARSPLVSIVPPLPASCRARLGMDSSAPVYSSVPAWPLLPSVSVPEPMAPIAATLRVPCSTVVVLPAPERLLDVLDSVSTPAPCLVNAPTPVKAPVVVNAPVLLIVPPFPASVIACIRLVASALPV